MDATDVLEIGREAVIVVLKVGAPVMLVALVVGVAISLIQALTQIQEMTLAFVPKIIATLASLILFFPFMLSALKTFTESLFAKFIGFG